MGRWFDSLGLLYEYVALFYQKLWFKFDGFSYRCWGVSYVFGDEKEYMIRNRDNPRIICSSCGGDFSANGAILFFGENPFDDCEKYDGIRYSIFQSASDMRPWSIGRKNLVRRAALAGMGFLEAFIKNEIWD